jgi:hypothetical protein
MRPFAGSGFQAGTAVAGMTEGMVSHQNMPRPAMPAIIRARKILLNALSVVVAGQVPVWYGIRVELPN